MGIGTTSPQQLLHLSAANPGGKIRLEMSQTGVANNDVTGEIGFKFELLTDQIITHLGMWDDHDRELPIRLARQLPTDLNSDQPSRTGRNPRNIQNNHFIRLWEIKITGTKKIAEIQIGPKHKSILEGEFRYGLLNTPVSLPVNSQFLLTMSTTAGSSSKST